MLPAGDLLASYAGFMAGESITALTVWDPSQPQPGTGSTGEAAGAEPGAVAASGEEQAGAPAVGSLRSHPITLEPESPSSAAVAAAAAARDERPWGGFIVAGTAICDSEGGGGGSGKAWADETSIGLQGRLLLLQVAPATFASAGGSRAGATSSAAAAAPGEEPAEQRRQLQLLPVAELHLPSRVLALCTGGTSLIGSSSGGGCGGSSGGVSDSSRLFASVGRRLVAFEWRQRQQLLRRVTWIPTNRPLCSLQVRCRAAVLSGLVLYWWLAG